MKVERNSASIELRFWSIAGSDNFADAIKICQTLATLRLALAGFQKNVRYGLENLVGPGRHWQNFGRIWHGWVRFCAEIVSNIHDYGGLPRC